MRLAIASALVAACASSAGAQNLGGPLPAFEAVRWYNTPPLSAEDLLGKAVLIDVFRTW
jgi:hypothetical protein